MSSQTPINAKGQKSDKPAGLSTYCMGVLLDLKGKKMYTSSYQYEMEYNPEGYAFNLISYENIGGKNDNIK